MLVRKYLLLVFYNCETNVLKEQGENTRPISNEHMLRTKHDTYYHKEKYGFSYSSKMAMLFYNENLKN